MAHIEKLSVDLPHDMVDMVQQAVDTGEYASAGDVMQDALREWTLRRTQRARAISDLRRLWDEGMASGPPVDGEESFARLHAALDAHLNSSGA
ncbi:type II toxin-antitoxin system ParD family antitoxin [Tistrella bauzanensis]|uniref:ribbon-helix-helix domain-containing protein n=1 Tax=Tistrella TaxID=171436 RepID=UPI0031F60C4C